MPDVEICIDCSEATSALVSAEAAVLGGAHRIECCSAMEVGGLTPDLEIMQAIIDSVGGRIDILAMIRPRSGDFNFSRPERLSMLTSAESLISMGVDGIVIGSLLDGEIDDTFCAELASFASYNGVTVTFHRAFDALLEPTQALSFLEENRVRRVLTSGNPWASNKKADEGIQTILAYSKASPNIEWVVGGGVSQANASTICDGLSGIPFSIHAYSSVLEDGVTSKEKVQALVELTKSKSQL